MKAGRFVKRIDGHGGEVVPAGVAQGLTREKCLF
jgi:hypothetical protein